MKTLDEVIKALELCTSPVLEDGCLHGCPYSDLVNECACDYNAIPQMQKDALHYLKEYQEIKQHLACMDRGEIRGDATQVTNNPPLTWEDLRQMEGKPVWIEPVKEWMLLTEVDEEDCDIWLLSLDGLDYDLMLHENWQAYRKERDEDAG